MTEFPTYSAILRFPLDVTGGEIKVPEAHRVLSVAPGRTEDGYPMDVWIECYPSEHAMVIPFKVYGTGHPLSPGLHGGPFDHVGTCVMPDGLVWHVYCMVSR